MSWHSHIRGGKWTLYFFLTFLVFLDLLSCFRKLFANLSRLRTGQLQRQHQRLRWQAASSSSPLSHAHVQLQRQDDRSQLSEGRGDGSVKTNGLEKKLKLEADDSERQTDRFPSLQCFCILFCMRSALATAWQPRACPLANPDNNR